MTQVTNQAGLTSKAYRIGTFSTFRAAMLADVARADLLAAFPDAMGAVPANPFSNWQPGTAGDYHTILIELWAYLADILTFYQERIANEAYLSTATARDSLVRLAQLVGYSAAPGAAARTQLAFTLGANQTTSIPANTRVTTKASAGAPPVTFETASATTAKSTWNAIPLSPVAVTNQFAPLSSFRTIFVSSPIKALPEFETIVSSFSDVYGKFGIDFFGAAYSTIGAWFSTGPVDAVTTTQESVEARTIVFEGVGLRINVGDMILTCQNENTGNEILNTYAVTSVNVDRTAETTAITWNEPAETTYTDSPVPVSVFVLRVKAGFFGNTAPLWQTLAPTLNNSDTFHSGAPYQSMNWDNPSDPSSQLPFDPYNNPSIVNPTTAADPTKLYLDARYTGIAASLTAPDRAYLIDQHSPANAQFVHLVDAQDVAITGYAQAAKVTRVTLDQAPDTTKTFAIRTTSLYAGGERLTRHDTLPLPDPVAGTSLILGGIFADLSDGQTVVVQGQGYDFTSGTANGQLQREIGTLGGQPVIDVAHGLTAVTLATSLVNSYARATTTLLANVVVASNGQTISGEILGTGDGTANQRYPLGKAPLTYLPAASADVMGGVSSTLSVTVNGVLWTESSNIDEQGPSDTVFEIDRPPDGSAAVLFGDGANGARPPSGALLRATYRQGIGNSGNVAAGAIASLLDRPPGVLAASNPLPAAGGVDPETIADLQTNASSLVQTFGRVVALNDLAALAQSYPGIAKAAATWQTRNSAGQSIARPYVELIVAAADLLPLAQHAPPLLPVLRAFLDASRDPNIPLRIIDAQPVAIVVSATLDINASYGRNATLAAAQAALGSQPATPGFFSLARRSFGETIALSSIYALLQGVTGVGDVVISAFAVGGGSVANAVSLTAMQLATLDPSSTLSLGGGGYVDS